MKLYYLGDDLLLTAAEAGTLLGAAPEAVEAWAAAGHLTWQACRDGVRRYPEPVVKALAARMETPDAPERYLTRREVAAILGVGSSRVTAMGRSGELPRGMPGAGGGQRLYPERDVLDLALRRQGRRHSPHLALHAGGLAATCRCLPAAEHFGVAEAWTAGEAREAFAAHLDAAVRRG